MISNHYYRSGGGTDSSHSAITSELLNLDETDKTLHIKVKDTILLVCLFEGYFENNYFCNWKVIGTCQEKDNYKGSQIKKSSVKMLQW